MEKETEGTQQHEKEIAHTCQEFRPNDSVPHSDGPCDACAKEKMMATYMAHWPGQSVFVCDRHLVTLVGVAKAMGFSLSASSYFGSDVICKNCENEAKKNAKQNV